MYKGVTFRDAITLYLIKSSLLLSFAIVAYLTWNSAP